MIDAASLALNTTKRSLLPWFLVAALLALSATGVAGMYAGYSIAAGRYAKDREAMLQAQAEAADAAQRAYEAAVKRGDEVSASFQTALDNLKVVNTTINRQVQVETQKLVYTDCKLPDSGADLLKKQVDEVNMRLLGKVAK